jgi:hypothetical protein
MRIECTLTGSSQKFTGVGDRARARSRSPFPPAARDHAGDRATQGSGPRSRNPRTLVRGRGRSNAAGWFWLLAYLLYVPVPSRKLGQHFFEIGPQEVGMSGFHNRRVVFEQSDCLVAISAK